MINKRIFFTYFVLAVFLFPASTVFASAGIMGDDCLFSQSKSNVGLLQTTRQSTESVSVDAETGNVVYGTNSKRSRGGKAIQE